jgi:enamine deaminase RidA (YjgF/YER057c/UK114 family)
MGEDAQSPPLRLPDVLPAKGAYLSAKRAGGLLFVSGHTGRTVDEPALIGVAGDDVDLDQARESARRAALNLLAAAAAAVDLSQWSLLQLRGYVRAVPTFTEHPAVIDAASALIVEALGQASQHARAAVGVSSLPGGAVVELEAIFALEHE